MTEIHSLVDFYKMYRIAEKLTLEEERRELVASWGQLHFLVYNENDDIRNPEDREERFMVSLTSTEVDTIIDSLCPKVKTDEN